MAILVTRTPQGVYPAYNDSYLQFISNLSNQTHAEIEIDGNPDFPDPFVIYSDEDGIYTFNFKDVAKVIFATGFRDSNFNTAVWDESVSGLYAGQTIGITVFTDTVEDDLTAYLQLSKSVKQPGDTISSELSQVLCPTLDGTNYYMTYFEGFPFHFDILHVAALEELKIISLNTSNEIDDIFPSVANSYRFNIDRGGQNNWTMENVLPLTENLNRLEFYANDVFKANLLITKKKICSGIYLKWWNRAGGYSHYLFEKFYERKTSSSNQGNVQNPDLENILSVEGGHATGLVLSTGKQATDTITVRAKYESYEYELLKDLFTSPSVQMYTSRTAYEEGKFIDVSVEGVMSYYNKKGKNELIAVVELPGMITAKL